MREAPDPPPSGATVVRADVADAEAVAAAVAEAAETLGGLDGVVCAAAVDCAWAPTARCSSPNGIARSPSTCPAPSTSVVRPSPTLVAAAGGAIVNVTSVAGFRAWPEDVAYNASKAGVELLTRTIAVEYGKHGVRANCLAPGVIDAGMTDAITQPEERARLVAQHPLGRLGRPTRWPNPLSGCSPAPPRSSRARRWWSTAGSGLTGDCSWPHA
jgi:NAD(P)-dependent dehydrogenase (short-subunit alcohol dehydrogenase family)